MHLRGVEVGHWVVLRLGGHGGTLSLGSFGLGLSLLDDAGGARGHCWGGHDTGGAGVIEGGGGGGGVMLLSLSC